MRARLLGREREEGRVEGSGKRRGKEHFLGGREGEGQRESFELGWVG